MRLLLLLVAACGGSAVPAPPVPTPAAVSPAAAAPAAPAKPITTTTLAAIGLDPTALDRTADPCEDFYQFACGGWVARTEIPADKSVAMRSFVDIEDANTAYLRDTLERERKIAGSRLGIYYGACMDEAAVARAKLSGLAPLRAAIDRVADARSLTAAVARLHAAGFEQILFDLSPSPDSKNAAQMIAGISQSGLALPDRDYYLADSADAKRLRDSYVAFLERVIRAVGAPGKARDVLALETALATASRDRVALRDPVATYNKIDKAGVAKLVPSFDWAAYWKTVGLDGVDGVDVQVPEFLAAIEPLVRSTPWTTWRTYLVVQLVSATAPYLTAELHDAKFAFDAAQTGQPQPEPRWKQCVASTVERMPDLVGEIFVRDRFPGDSKAAAERYVQAISAAMVTNLDALPWMDATTRTRARAKLAAMIYQIGYPKTWQRYDVPLAATTYAANALRLLALARGRELARIGKPVDREQWQIAPSMVNAFYSASRNRMVFPAGILQQPLYSLHAAASVNLGAIGMIVGHELTHGFDDQGSQFDAVGNLTNWWEPATLAQFQTRTWCVIDQYARYDVAGVKLSGANTVGENIADIGGVKLSLTAMRTLRAAAPETVVADGFTEDQQFFLGFGQAWCTKMRPDLEKLMVATDEHSPPIWRVNGALAATPEFARAFSCRAGQRLAPVKPCAVW
jgi:putative endopeptidase